jgi:hypothetical protein
MSPSRAEFYDAFRRYLADPAGAARKPCAVEDAQAFQAKVHGSDMRYGGEPLDVAYFPLALVPADRDRLARDVEATLALLERATRRFLERPDLAREAYGWDERRLRLAAHDPGYALAIPCARFDSYWDGSGSSREGASGSEADGLPPERSGGGKGLQFLEVNTDGTSGMTNVERVSEMFLESEGVRALAGRGFRLRTFDLRARVFEALIACWEQFRASRKGAPPREPRIAIVDWRTVKTSAEFLALVRDFEARGVRATIADPRDLRFDGARLLDGAGEPVDLVYRRVVSTEFFAAPREDVRALEEAFLAGAVCLVGSFRSDVAFDKRLLALLTDEVTAARDLGLATDDLALAARVLPRTRILRPGPLLEESLRDRERLVLKPAGLYEGRGVRVGVETPEPAWRAALEEAAPRGDHVVQERVVPPELTIELVEAGKWRPRALYLSLGEYAFGGRLSGFNARVASTLVLSADDDERLLPVVLVE